MKSSRSRSRSKNSRNRNPNNSGGGNVINRVFDSSGPESKVRGTPQQIIDKYNQLARDAHLSGDRVAMENFQQHAEHYLRLLSEAQREVDARREEQERQNRERQADRDRHADRDRERTQRQEGDAVSDPGHAPQPEAVEADGESALVETPESQPRPKNTRARKPRNKPNPKPDASQPSDETPVDSGSAPEAAE